jgi:heptosyltransferase-2
LKDLEPDKIRRIVVRTANWIGDAVMTLPAMVALRETYPGAHIAVVANPVAAQLLANHPACDEIIVYDKQGDHAGLIGLLKFASRLRRGRFDLAILFQYAIEAGFMTALAGVPRRLGFATDGRRFLLTHPVPFTDRVQKLHQVDAFLQVLGHYDIGAAARVQTLCLLESERAWAQQQLGQSPVAVINPGAAYGSAKRWYPERFAAVADFLAREHGLQVVLIGGPAEVEIGRDIAAAMQAPALNFIGTTSVRQMMALVDAAALMITNDSGPMHVAAAFDVPIVAVFGPTDHTTTSPFARRYRIVRHAVECSPCLLRECPIDHRCMTRVTVDDVTAAAQSLLQESP